MGAGGFVAGVPASHSAGLSCSLSSGSAHLLPTVLGDIPTGVFYVKPTCPLQRLCYIEAALSPLGPPPSLLQELPL